MEAELEEERKARSSAQNAKKKLELDIKDMEEQLEAASKVKEDGIRQLKKYQQQVKDIQRDLDEATSSRDQIAEHARENEKKLKNLETEFLQMQEVRLCLLKRLTVCILAKFILTTGNSSVIYPAMISPFSITH
jgi:chromosome segregation ATPase